MFAFNAADSLASPRERRPDGASVLALLGEIPGLRSYDAEFLSLAGPGCRLVTSDATLLRAAGSLAVAPSQAI